MVCTVGVGTSADYYLNEQSEYYTGGKEPTGKWFTPSDQFGLQNGSAVDASIFHSLHNGKDLKGNVLELGNRSINANRVGGYDLTFSAPKSVSVIWAVSDEATRALIENAQEKAARAALDVVSKNAAYCRRGKGGKLLENVELTGATFQHGEARPTLRDDGTLVSDPQLHTHSVIFNIAQRQDGSWGALDGRHFFKWKMTAGVVYRTELAHELQKALGCEIEVTDDGMFEISGVPQNVRDQFSSRRAEINEKLSAMNLESKEAQAMASTITKNTRASKRTNIETSADRHERWKAEAESLGFNDEQLKEYERSSRVQVLSTEFEGQLHKIPAILTEHEAVFRLETVYREVSKLALGQGQSTQMIEASVQKLMQEGKIVELGPDELGLPVYSTQEMIDVENELISMAQQGGELYDHGLEKSFVEEALAKVQLSQEQKDAACHVTVGADLTVLEGSAGAGKTHTLKTVSDLYKAEGYRVIGTSTAWRMANQLGEELSIHSQATDAWLSQEKKGQSFLDEKTVLIVDEAGLLSSKQMHRILKANENAKAKIILTGDQRQLQAIGAGSGLRLVAEQTGVVRIDTIVRQKHAWMRQTIDDFSLGRTEEAIKAFENNRSVIWCENDKASIKRAVGDWKGFKKLHPHKTAIVMAKTNKQVRDLNGEIREHLRSIGMVRGNDTLLPIEGINKHDQMLPIAHGDQIVFKKRIDDLNVVNGSIATIKTITASKNDIQFNVEIGGQLKSFKASEIANDKGKIPITHGYASTIYSAQGMTTDAAFVLADHKLNRHEIYVATSRAKELCRLYVDKSKLDSEVIEKRLLLDRKKRVVTEEQRRNVLKENWSQARVKSTTQDYKKTTSSTLQKEIAINSKNSVSQNIVSKWLPSIGKGL